MDQETISKVRELVKSSKRIVFLGGAGVSTGSGIPDFRSPQGLYNIRSKYGVPYEVMLSHEYFFEETENFYDFYWSTMVAPEAKPNKAHLALAEFEKRRPHDLVVVTQNIDGLHQKAGSIRVLEAHGTTLSYHCEGCEKHYDLDQIPHHGVPKCPVCGRLIKPDVVLYGEPLDEATITSAVQAVNYADLLIVGGTSMKVYPIAGLPSYFKGNAIVMINREPTDFDRVADYVIHDDIGDALEAILKE
ncbi:MAG: NAD-dependent protein deacylase [Bacilli bacterium]|nr:NAD-dependent protein deacylase [Bacilli bacterium]